MSNAAPPGWYPDPWRQAPQRFWDGWQWTPHISAGGLPVRTRLPEGAPVYGPTVWILALAPLLGIAGFAFMRIDMTPFIDFVNASEQAGPDAPLPFFDPMSMFGRGFWVAELLSLLLTATLIVLAYRDHQQLGRLGVVRPFHRAWAFLGSIVYVIGRGVIVHKVAAPRGLAPTWAAIAGYVVVLVSSWIWMAAFMASVAEQLSAGLN